MQRARHAAPRASRWRAPPSSLSLRSSVCFRFCRGPSRNALRARACAPGRTRTCDLEIRRLLLYPLSYGGHGTRAGCRRQCRCAGCRAPVNRRGGAAPHLVPRPVPPFARQVRRHDRDVRRDPRRPGVRRQHPHPARRVLGPREPAQGQVRHERPALRARPGHRAGRPHAARQPTQRLGPAAQPPDPPSRPRPAHSTFARVTSGKHPPPATASPSRRRPRRDARHGIHHVVDDPVGRRPHERQGQVPLARAATSAAPGPTTGARRGTRRGAPRHPRGVRSTRRVAWWTSSGAPR